MELIDFRGSIPYSAIVTAPPGIGPSGLDVISKMKADAHVFLVIVLLAIGGCEQRYRIHPDARHFEERLVALIDQNRKAAPADGTLYADEKFFLLMSRDCASEAKHSPDKASVMMAAMKDFYDSGSAVLGDVNSSMDKFEEAGGLDFAVILAAPSQQSLRAHLERIRGVKRALDALATTEAESKKKFRDLLTAGGVHDHVLEDATQVFLRQTTASARIEHREADAEFMDAGIEALQLLHDNPGVWEITDKPSMRFKDDRLGQKWEELMNRLLKAKQQSDDA